MSSYRRNCAANRPPRPPPDRNRPPFPRPPPGRRPADIRSAITPPVHLDIPAQDGAAWNLSHRPAPRPPTPLACPRPQPGSPAHAGIDREMRALPAFRSGFPRTRGV